VNGGEHWTRAGGNLPPVSVNDIQIKNGDLVLATYGRGIIILDDAEFLAESTENVVEGDAYLFPVRDAELFYQNNRDLSNKAARFAGPNPDYGALITYYLREDPDPTASPAPGVASEDEPSPGEPAEVEANEDESSDETDQDSGPPEVTIQILDSQGEVIRELAGPDRQGFNRIAWDLRMPAPSPTDSAGASAGEEQRRRPEWVDVEPGEYTVKLTARGLEMVQTVTVVPDKRLEAK
jgi:hypothetical protein